MTPGGRALKFYSSVRLDIRKIETLKNGSEQIGSRTRARCQNKIAPPFREAEFDVMYGRGISRVGELLDLAVRLEVIQKSGAWFLIRRTGWARGATTQRNIWRRTPRLPARLSSRCGIMSTSCTPKIRRPQRHRRQKPVEPSVGEPAAAAAPAVRRI